MRPSLGPRLLTCLATRHVLLPASLPQLLTGVRLGKAILVAVGIEFVQGSDGIGGVIWQSWSLFLARRRYVGIVAMALMGVEVDQDAG